MNQPKQEKDKDVETRSQSQCRAGVSQCIAEEDFRWGVIPQYQNSGTYATGQKDTNSEP